MWTFQVCANFFALAWTVGHHLGQTKGHDEGWFIVLEVTLPDSEVSDGSGDY